MAGIQVAETSKPKKGPKTLKRLEIESQLGGGHVVRHVYTDYAHEPREVKFNKDGKSQGGETINAHLAKHAGLPGAGAGEEAGEAEGGEEAES
jgi:hypothetical protein